MDSDILIIDDDAGTIQLLARMLTGVGRLRFATNGADALRLMRDQVPDLALLDADMPDMSGFEVCEALKADPALADTPVIFVTSHRDAEFELKGFASGAADFIVKPVSEPLLVARVKTQLRIKQMTDELRRLSTTDVLTSVANRRRFDETLAAEWQRCRRGGQLSLLLIDVDHFKLFNDRYGHPAGDDCLRRVAAALLSACPRSSDTVARYGGEEFAVILPQTARQGASQVVCRIFDAIAEMGISHALSPTSDRVTVSVGISACDETSACWGNEHAFDSVGAVEGACSAADLVLAADRALYAAKQAGRARAWLLDITDWNFPLRGFEIGSAKSPPNLGSLPHRVTENLHPTTIA